MEADDLQWVHQDTYPIACNWKVFNDNCASLAAPAHCLCQPEPLLSAVGTDRPQVLLRQLSVGSHTGCSTEATCVCCCNSPPASRQLACISWITSQHCSADSCAHADLDTCYHCSFAHPGLSAALDLSEYTNEVHDNVSFQLSPLASSEDLQNTDPSYNNIVSSRIEGVCLVHGGC